MESLAYIITNKFLIVAFDGNLQVKASDMELKLTKINKVFKTNDSTMISIVGNLKEMTKLYRYVLELYRHNKDMKPEDIIADIKDLRPKDMNDLMVGIKDVLEIAEELNNKELTELDAQIILQKLQNNKTVQELLKDVGDKNDPKKNLNFVHIFNYNPEKGINCNALNLVGNYVIEPYKIDNSNIPKNSFFIGIASSIMDEAELAKVRVKYVNRIKSLFESIDWEDLPLEPSMLDESKKLLSDALTEICPFKETPDVYFYEIGQHTDYKVIKPKTELSEINFNDPIEEDKK